MARIILTSLLLFHFVLIPSMAFPSAIPHGIGLGFGYGGGIGDENDPPLPFPPDQEEQADEPQQPINVNANLKEGFYSDSCPNAERIVADALADIVRTNPNAIANLIRLQFHDCFVVGCDASILLDYSPAGDKVEKSSMFNGLLLKGADLIDDIKRKLEEECPGVVSCADTMAFATNEAMSLAGLPRQPPLGGRRDSLYSLATVAEDNNLPLPNWNADQMIELFNRKGFTPEEMVILLGAHSVGAAHCDVFMERVYNYKNTFKPDPALPLPVVDELKQICSNPGTPQFRNPPVNFDETPTLLDNLFFKDMVEKSKTLLITDAHLIGDPRTAPVVKQMADDVGLFQKRFAELMIRLSAMNVLTGNDGEVRKICRSTN
ncbi:Secretory peroxidase [Sesbania bispinosa]|nr:Secretory peroxidase [Sesbania bispinosa]